jgi:Tfp pilus assembly protein PilV
VLVAVLVFTIGVVAFAGSSAVIGRALRQNGIREHAARVARSRLDVIAANCRAAVAGHETVGLIDSDWSLSTDTSRVAAVETVTYAGAQGRRTDTYEVLLACP